MFIMSLKQISNAQPQHGNQRGVYATKTPSLKKACRVSGTSPAKSPKTYRMSPVVPLGPFGGSGDIWVLDMGVGTWNFLKISDRKVREENFSLRSKNVKKKTGRDGKNPNLQSRQYHLWILMRPQRHQNHLEHKRFWGVFFP